MDNNMPIKPIAQNKDEKIGVATHHKIDVEK